VANQRRVRLAERWRGDAGEHLSRREDSEDGRRRRPNRMANAAREAVMLTVDEVTQIYRDEARIIRDELNSIPRRAVEALEQLPADERRNPSICEDVLDSIINDSLRTISATGADHVSA
jgi:hypothetical protein